MFHVLPFYDTYMEKPKVKKLNNVEILKELPFNDELSIVKNKTAFRGYAQSYKIEIADERDVIIQLKASTYMKLPVELRHPMKGLISIPNNDNKCFLWCHVRHLKLNAVKLNRITKKDREFIKKLNYSGVVFPVLKKDHGKIKTLNKICVNVFCYENKVIYSVYLSNLCFNDSIDLLLISNNFTSSHYVNIKDFNRPMFNKTKHKGKKYFYKSCLQCFSSENVLN